MTEEKVVKIGRVTHFFSKINVAVIELTGAVSVGDRIMFKGPNTDFEQVVDSMQIEHESIGHADAGQSIGLKVDDRVRETDAVYRKLE